MGAVKRLRILTVEHVCKRIIDSIGLLIPIYLKRIRLGLQVLLALGVGFFAKPNCGHEVIAGRVGPLGRGNGVVRSQSYLEIQIEETILGTSRLGGKQLQSGYAIIETDI